MVLKRYRSGDAIQKVSCLQWFTIPGSVNQPPFEIRVQGSVRQASERWKRAGRLGACQKDREMPKPNIPFNYPFQISLPYILSKNIKRTIRGFFDTNTINVTAFYDRVKVHNQNKKAALLKEANKIRKYRERHVSLRSYIFRPLISHTMVSYRQRLTKRTRNDRQYAP